MRGLLRVGAWVAGTGLALAGTYVGVGLLRAHRPRRPFLDHARPWVIAHRGAAALWPENTLRAFAGSLEMGADVLELDVQPTEEGLPVVIHDETVDRTTDGHGPVSRLSIADLRRLDAGHRFSPEGGGYPHRGVGLRIPTLEEVLAVFPQARLVVEIKAANDSLWANMRALVERHECHDRVLLVSSEESIRRRISRDFPDVARGASSMEVLEAMVFARLGLARLWRPTCDALQVPEVHEGITVLTPGLVSTAHRQGVEVHVWTVDGPHDMERLLDWGVDGIVTDRPDLLIALLRRRGVR